MPGLSLGTPKFIQLARHSVDFSSDLSSDSSLIEAIS